MIKKIIHISLKIKNKGQLIEHYRKQGIRTITPDNLHCTIAFSDKDFKHVSQQKEIKILNKEIEPCLSYFNKNSLVIKFKNNEVEKLFSQCIKEGATYDHIEYQSHITISRQPNVDLSKIIKPNFDIILFKETIKTLEKRI